MGVRILVGTEYEDGPDRAVLFDSCTDWAFGPVMDSREEAEGFLSWLGRRRIDPRLVEDSKLEANFHDFRVERDARLKLKCPGCGCSMADYVGATEGDRCEDCLEIEANAP